MGLFKKVNIKFHSITIFNDALFLKSNNLFIEDGDVYFFENFSFNNTKVDVLLKCYIERQVSTRNQGFHVANSHDSPLFTISLCVKVVENILFCFIKAKI